MVSSGATFNFILLSILALAPAAIQAAPTGPGGMAGALMALANSMQAQKAADELKEANVINKLLKAGADDAIGLV